jgi:hypothetical protein
MNSIFIKYGVLASVSSATFEWVFYGTSSSSDQYPTYPYGYYFEGATDDLSEMIDIINADLDQEVYEGDFAVFYSTSDTTYYFFEAVAL